MVYRDDLATLRLKVDNVQPLHVRQLGTIFDKLSIAYDRYALPQGGERGRNRLAIERLEIGSVIADMIDVAAATVTLYENRELLGGFVAQLSDILHLVRSHSATHVAAADRNAVEALAGPVATGVAQRVTLSVVGDNNTILIIERDAAVEVTHKIAGERRRRVDTSAIEDAEVEALLARKPTNDTYAQVVAEARENVARAAEAVEPFAREAHHQLTAASIRYNRAPSSHLPQASTTDPVTQDAPRHGTLFNLGGTWYVRLEGLGGVLVPFSLRGEGALVDGQMYELTGKLEFQNMRPVRYEAKTAIPIGNRPVQI